MATNHTENYQLNLWEPGDKFLRTDFNADNAKLDAALAAKGNCRIVCGSYVGTGSYGDSENSATVLQLGFTPRLVIVKGDYSGMGFFIWPTIRATHLYASGNSGTSFNVVWTEEGLKWWLINTYKESASGQLNTEGETFYYIALA